MKKTETTKLVKAKVFAQAYLDNGLNATKAMQVVNPELTPGSASELGSKQLNKLETVGAIDSLMSGARAHWEGIAKNCMTALEAIALTGDVEAHKLLIEYGKILAPASVGPKSLTQVNKYTLPKR